MDLEKALKAMSDMQLQQRSNYHFTYGDLIDALRAASEDALFDKRVVGLGSYRGYYVDIALYTEREGCTASDTDESFSGDWDTEYDVWSKKHEVGATTIPTKAHELADFLEKLLGNYFTGWKGGEYEITRDKPLWLEKEPARSSDTAVVGIGKDLILMTKVIE